MIKSMRLALVGSAVVLCAVSLYNGYPLFYSDTNAYLLSGFHLDTPTTRPITYGLFMLMTSLGWSLWPVIFIQSLILSFLIWCCVKYCVSTDKVSSESFWIVVLLTILTGVSWVSSELIADVFTPVSIISLALLLCVRNLSGPHLILLYFIFFLSNAAHISHMGISLALIIVAVCFQNLFKSRVPVFKRAGMCLLLVGFGYITMSSSVAKSRHIFVIAHLNELGVLKEYLDEKCPTENFKLCPYKDSLPVDFVWDQKQSPVYREEIGWVKSQDEFDYITRDILTTPKYLKRILGTSAVWTVNQLYSFKVGNGNHPFTSESEVFTTISEIFPNERKQFLSSMQNRGELLPVPFLDFIHSIVMVISIMVIIFFIAKRNLRLLIRPELRLVSLFILIAIIANAAICVTIITVIDRFGCRVMWMIPLIALLCILSFLRAPHEASILMQTPAT